MEKKIQPKKTQAVSELAGVLSSAKDFFFTEYQGLNVAQLTSLRKELSQLNASYKVVKNSIARAVLKQVDRSYLDKYLLGSSAMMFTYGDESGPAAKALVDFSKENKALVIKGAYISGEEYDALQVIAYSQLPTRIDLIAMLARVFNEPMAQLARALQAVSEKNHV